MILVECFLDTFVVTQLGITKSARKHAEGKGNVVNLLMNNPKYTKGIIDEDPDKTQPREMKRFNVIDDQMGSLGLQLLENRRLEKRIIVIEEDMEHWLYKRANSHDINPETYGLPRTGVELHEIPRVEQRPNFEKFFGELMSKSDVGLNKLRSWL